MEKICKLTGITTIFCIIVSLLCGCASMRPPIIRTSDDNISNYRYFVVAPIDNYVSKIGVYNGKSGVYVEKEEAIDPAPIISGILLKNGFIPITEVTPNNVKETMIVNFGETDRRSVNLGYSIEVTIQFVSAYSKSLICSCTAEGQGWTEADDVRIAIQRALKPLFDSDE